MSTTTATSVAATNKKVIYSNDLMLKLRHMAPQPPAVSTIPDGARGIFVLPNLAGVTIHTVAVQKKVKNTTATATSIANATGPIIGTAVAPANAAAASAAAAAFTVTSSSTSAAAAAAPATAALQSGYAAALKAMSDAEREKLQEVRTAFLTRANENKALAAAAAVAASSVATTTATKKDGTATTDAAPTTSAPKQWAKTVAPTSGANLAELVPSQPISRNERKRLEEAAKGTRARSAAAGGEGAASNNKGATTAGNNGRNRNASNNNAAAADNNKRRGVSAAPRTGHHTAAPERYPAFMVNTANVVNADNLLAKAVPTAATAAAESFFIGADGRKYPMPANPFINLISNLGLANNNSDNNGAHPPMGAAEWYGWWAQQAAFFPEYYPVPVEIPVDAQGNVLPLPAVVPSATASSSTKKRGARASSKAPTGGENNTTEAAAAKSATSASATTAATTAAAAPRQLGKGRTAPAILTGDSLEARHRQRERQIVLGKRTLGYLVYEKMRAAAAAATAAAAQSKANGAVVSTATSPIEIPSDCHAPPFAQPCSKRSWDGQVRRWRNALHKLDKFAEVYLTAEERALFPHTSASARELDMGDDDEDEQDEEAATA